MVGNVSDTKVFDEMFSYSVVVGTKERVMYIYKNIVDDDIIKVCEYIYINFTCIILYNIVIITR